MTRSRSALRILATWLHSEAIYGAGYIIPFLRRSCTLLLTVPFCIFVFIIVPPEQTRQFKVVVITQTLFNQDTCIAKLPFGIILYQAVYPAKLFNFLHLFNTHAATPGCGLDKY